MAMTGVGWLDPLLPSTMVGRIIVLASTAWGLFLILCGVAVVGEVLEMTRTESKVTGG